MNSGGAGALIAIVAVLLLIVGGAGFYWALERQRQVSAAAMAQARAAEAEARSQVELVRAEAARASRRSADVPPPTPDAEGAIRTAVESVLRTQQEAWNRGDVEAFAEHYWKDDALTFSSAGKTTRGWDATVRNYRERYPTRSEMGRLEFGNVEITPLGEAAALVLGEWRLERDSEPLSGNFSLVFRNIDGRWVIIHDHTSRRVD
jgi:uncharacterized protein (TIGR02246 family)